MLLSTNFKKLVAVRSRMVYEFILNLLPNPQVSPKPEIELMFLTMTGAKHLPFLQQCLFSLYTSWSSIPKLQIVSDGSITISKLEEALAWWTGTKSFSYWEESVSYHRQKGCESVAQFAEKNLLGKKLAILLEFGKCGATLWCDNDILWFKELPGLPLKDQDSDLPILKVSEDFMASYDIDILEQSLSHLYSPPFINTGLVFLKGDLLQASNLDHLLKIAAENSEFHTEQTIIAEAAYQLGNSTWSPEEIACFAKDKFSITSNYAGKQWAARHYFSPVRHLFFRDAFALRLGLKQKLFEQQNI
ncbi:hypothetical protein [Nostoc sp.]|uniref:hypothetical protein n=1 Tax=Nostoc sp. TaxID=1180 RepID=UPI002FF58C52